MEKKQFDKESFREKLENSGEFPMLYMFKFIVPNGKEAEVASLFPRNKVKTKASSNGKYVSSTIQAMMDNPDDIIRIYEQASEIEGLIAL